MFRMIRVAGMLSTLFALFIGVVSAVQAQSAIEMEILRDNLAADKKLIIDANLQLSDAEAAAFWPIYDEYQIEIEVINSRIGWLIRDFGVAQNAGAISDEQAERFIDEAISIDEDEVAIRKKFSKRFLRDVSAAQVARYIQIENKIRALIRFDLAATIPLVE
jgi:hypothetical protein